MIAILNTEILKYLKVFAANLALTSMVISYQIKQEKMFFIFSLLSKELFLPEQKMKLVVGQISAMNVWQRLPEVLAVLLGLFTMKTWIIYSVEI